MTIHIEDLKFQAIIGILDFERVTPQDIIINLEIEYDYKDEFIDYVKVVKLLTIIMKKQQYLLIEDAIRELTLKLTEEFSSIKSIDLKITKPSIMPECVVSVSNRITL